MKERALDFLFLSAFLFLGFSLSMGYSSYTDFNQYKKLVGHTFQVQNQILKLESEFRNMVSNQRSYLLTEDKAYLTRYHKEKKAIKKSTKELRMLISDDPQQLKSLAALTKNLKRREITLNEELGLSGKNFPQ